MKRSLVSTDYGSRQFNRPDPRPQIPAPNLDSRPLFCEIEEVKTTVIKLALNRWPYGLEVHPSARGLLLRPCRKARAHWTKAFRPPLLPAADLALTRITNDFDAKEWEW